MKLYSSPTSPYTRKVRALIIEKGLSGLVRFERADVWGDPGALLDDNPLGKVPCLVTDEGLALHDSRVICAYLDAHPSGTGPALVPASGDARWRVLKAEALADGVLDCAVGMIVETRKPEGERSAWMVARWTAAIGRALDTMTGDTAALPGGVTLGHIALACALGYLDFRHPSLAWREGRPELARWYGALEGRACLAETVPAA